MQLFIENERNAMTYIEDEFLCDVLDRVEKDLGMTHMIAEVRVDEESVTAETKDEIFYRKARDIQRVDLKLIDTNTIIQNAIHEGEAYIGKLRAGFEGVSSHLQTGKREKAYQILSECLTGWIDIIKLMQVVEKMLDVNYDVLNVRGQSIDAMYQDLFQQLAETREAMQNEDMVLLSDLIEYEVIPRLSNQENVFKALTKIALSKT